MINCIILDDEPLALLKLAEYIKRIPFLTLEKACLETHEAQSLLEGKNIDLLFTDIDMPDKNGIEFIRSLTRPPMVIFTTAYPMYAIEGFKLNAVDYLLKPFEFEDCLHAAEKAQKMQSLSQSIPATAETENPETLFVKSDYKVVRINIDSINYIESMSEYIRIYTDEREKPVTTLYSLQRWRLVYPLISCEYIAHISSICRKSKKFPDSESAFHPKH